MVAPRLLIALIGITLLTSSAACNSDGHAPTAPGSLAASYQVAITGTVRDSAGQPIPAARVVGWVESMRGTHSPTETDASGRFALSLAVPLTPAQVSLQATSTGYRYFRGTTTYVPGNDLAADLRLQRSLSVNVDRPLASVVPPGDSTWTPWSTDGVCGQCQLVSIGADGRSYIVAVAWSGAIRPTLWLAGVNSAQDDVFQAIGVPIPGEQRVEAVVPAGIWPTAYVGLPMGVTLAEPLAYEISVRPN